MAQAPRCTPDPAALARQFGFQDDDVLRLIDARGSAAYPASADSGLANHFPSPCPRSADAPLHGPCQAVASCARPLGLPEKYEQPLTMGLDSRGFERAAPSRAGRLRARGGRALR
jgi:hypothetical protein